MDIEVQQLIPAQRGWYAVYLERGEPQLVPGQELPQWLGSLWRLKSSSTS